MATTPSRPSHRTNLSGIERNARWYDQKVSDRDIVSRDTVSVSPTSWRGRRPCLLISTRSVVIVEVVANACTHHFASGAPRLCHEGCVTWQPGVVAGEPQRTIPLDHTSPIFRPRFTATLVSRGHQLDGSDSTGWLSVSSRSLRHEGHEQRASKAGSAGNDEGGHPYTRIGGTCGRVFEYTS